MEENFHILAKLFTKSTKFFAFKTFYTYGRVNTCFLYRCVKWQQNRGDKSPCYPCVLDELYSQELDACCSYSCNAIISNTLINDDCTKGNCIGLGYRLL